MTGVAAGGMHGLMGDPAWEAPILVTHADIDARPGYRSMKAHEYTEHPSVLRPKVALLARLLRTSSACLAYTGAGISTSSGIDDYASKTGSVAMKRRSVRSGFEALPTFAHHVLTALHRAGHLKQWVQQNHDGLPQKAGYPQHDLNEIHGAWHDPSNPVVPMSGSLRGDLFDRVLEWEDRADLVLAIGTSLCGMNTDRLVEMASTRAVEGSGLGSVIISLQRTPHDELSSLRIFGTIDEVMVLLAEEMALDVWSPQLYTPAHPPSAVAGPDVFRVPYDDDGRRIGVGTRLWHLTPGTPVRVTAGPGEGYVGTVLGKTPDGHYRVRLPCQREGSDEQGRVAKVYVLGSWWTESAVRGLSPRLPIVDTS